MDVDVAAKLNATIVSIDPFTGDVNMWTWEKQHRDQRKWFFLRNEKGRPTIYDRFRANMVEAGYADMIVPIVASSIVGIKLLGRLFDEKRIPMLPQVLYLDSAHEEGETFLELHRAWDILPPGGVLFGDDFGWKAVQNDVLKFSKHIGINAALSKKYIEQLPECTMTGSPAHVVLCDYQWLLFKPSEGGEHIPY